jgi:hypothetical protein
MASRRGTSLPQVIARIAFPVFPRDKVASEVSCSLVDIRRLTQGVRQVATLQYIATHTSVPVPQVYAWDDDGSGPVGAEYMLLEKVLTSPQRLC